MRQVLGNYIVWLVIGMLLVTSCAVIDRKWFGRSKEGKDWIQVYYKPNSYNISVIELEITNYGDKPLKLDYYTDEYILNTIPYRGSTNLYDGSIYKGSIPIKLKPTTSPSKYSTIIEPLGRHYIQLKGFAGDYKLIDNIIVKLESGEKTIVMNRIGINKEILDNRSNFEKGEAYLRIGMTKTEVWNIIGQPDGIYFYLDSTVVTALGTSECYNINNPRVMLYFLDGKLESWMKY